MFVSVLILPIEKLGVYNQLQNIERGALYRCEAEGGLTDATKTIILKDASARGLDTSKITIICNMPITSDDKAVSTFGDEIDLTLSYAYTYSSPKLQGFTLSAGDIKTETIVVKTSTTSKN